MEETYDIVIIGGGPAGLTAALYAARQEVKTVVLEARNFGGQLLMAREIENYPGFGSVAGPELAKKMEEQAKAAGATLKRCEVVEIKKEGDYFVIRTNRDNTYRCVAVILATGAEHRRLGVPGEGEFTGRGVSYCTTCDAQFFKGRTVTVIGGGNTAVDSALLLSKIAKKVYLVHRREEFRADAVLMDKLKEKENVELMIHTVCKAIKGDKLVTSIELENVKTGEKKDLPTDGVFINIGVAATTQIANQLGCVILENGFLETGEDRETTVEGVYAAGDLIGGIRQITNAVGHGTVAALSAVKYVEEKTGVKTRSVDWE